MRRGGGAVEARELNAGRRGRMLRRRVSRLGRHLVHRVHRHQAQRPGPQLVDQFGRLPQLFRHRRRPARAGQQRRDPAHDLLRLARLAAVEVLPGVAALRHRLPELLRLHAVPVDEHQAVEHRVGQVYVSFIQRRLHPLADLPADFGDEPGKGRVRRGVGGADAGQLADRGLPVVALDRGLGAGRGTFDRGPPGLDILQHYRRPALLERDRREHLSAGGEVAAVDLVAGGGHEPRLAALLAVPAEQRLGRLAAKLDHLRHQPAQPARLVRVGGGFGQPAGVEVLAAPLHQRPDELRHEPLAAAVAPHVVAVRQAERLVQPPVRQGTLCLSNAKDQHGPRSRMGVIQYTGVEG